jgi:PAS domain-containing protein
MSDNNPLHAWVQSFPGMVSVCDSDGVILAMNDAAIRAFEKYGGAKLIGQNALDCHPGKSRELFAELLRNPRLNVYTTEKNGVHKIVYQCPWHCDGKYAGLLEIVAEIPAKMRHFVRQP